MKALDKEKSVFNSRIGIIMKNEIILFLFDEFAGHKKDKNDLPKAIINF